MENNKIDDIINATVPYIHIKEDSATKIQVEAAIRDGDGNKITTHYQKKLKNNIIDLQEVD